MKKQNPVRGGLYKISSDCRRQQLKRQMDSRPCLNYLVIIFWFMRSHEFGWPIQPKSMNRRLNHMLFQLWALNGGQMACSSTQGDVHHYVHGASWPVLCFTGNSSLQGCLFQFQFTFGKLKWQQNFQAWDGKVQWFLVAWDVKVQGFYRPGTARFRAEVNNVKLTAVHPQQYEKSWSDNYIHTTRDF